MTYDQKIGIDCEHCEQYLLTHGKQAAGFPKSCDPCLAEQQPEPRNEQDPTT